MENIRLFISAVTDEFGSAQTPSLAPTGIGSPLTNYRTYLRTTLSTSDVDVKVQEDFAPGGKPTLIKVMSYIKKCHAVIHLVGDQTGAAPADGGESFLRDYSDLAKELPWFADRDNVRAFSYTQWEAYLAICLKKPLFICRAQGEAVRFKDEAQRKRQQEHLARLKELDRHSIPFSRAEELVVNISRFLMSEIWPEKKDSDDSEFLAGDYVARRATFDEVQEIAQISARTYGADAIPRDVRKSWYDRNRFGFLVFVRSKPTDQQEKPNSIVELLPLSLAGTEFVVSREFREEDIQPRHIARQGEYDVVDGPDAGYRNFYIENFFNTQEGRGTPVLRLAMKHAEQILYSARASTDAVLYTMVIPNDLRDFLIKRLGFEKHGPTLQGYDMLRVTAAELKRRCKSRFGT